MGRAGSAHEMRNCSLAQPTNFAGLGRTLNSIVLGQPSLALYQDGPEQAHGHRPIVASVIEFRIGGVNIINFR
ncbi:hypothetical protein L484_009934 [Morus notabilis]|uniref:Uncharacterized protein n=1 Tax=Morus notabilis TaxID=981085 RepID=W9SF89_9ROSA|nr:hypothetical protein L484_009934 [Morus notabilis]